MKWLTNLRVERSWSSQVKGKKVHISPYIARMHIKPNFTMEGFSSDLLHKSQVMWVVRCTSLLSVIMYSNSSCRIRRVREPCVYYIYCVRKVKVTGSQRHAWNLEYFFKCYESINTTSWAVNQHYLPAYIYSLRNLFIKIPSLELFWYARLLGEWSCSPLRADTGCDPSTYLMKH